MEKKRAKKLTIPVSSGDLRAAIVAAELMEVTLQDLMRFTAFGMINRPESCCRGLRLPGGKARIGVSLPPGLYARLAKIREIGGLTSMSDAVRAVLAEAGRRTA